MRIDFNKIYSRIEFGKDDIKIITYKYKLKKPGENKDDNKSLANSEDQVKRVGAQSYRSALSSICLALKNSIVF